MPENSGDNVRRKTKNWFWINNRILDDQLIKGSALLVYVALCRHADEKKQTCFPSLKLLSEETGLKRNTIVKVVKQLESLKLIKKIQGGGSKHPNHYTLLKEQFKLDTVMEKGFNSDPKQVNRDTVNSSNGIQEEDSIKKTKEEDSLKVEEIKSAIRKKFPKKKLSPITKTYPAQ